ncbi:putative ubiquitin-conjugating enzyme E2 21 [Halotydeus destructor]|nr:putative ubiquitin-conjugating enzyme E2 21 [Halotydeus destructor]
MAVETGAASSQSMKRIQRDIKELQSSPDGDNQVWAELCEDSLKQLKGFIRGPPETPYEGGIFELDITLPDTYPFVAPTVRFKTSVWHPNVSSQSGYICLDILSDQWSASLTLKAVLMSLQALLQEPQVDDPQDAVVARQMRRSKKRFQATARYWTVIYAKPADAEMPSDLVEFQDKVVKMMDSRRVDRDRAIQILSNNNWRTDPVKKSVRNARRTTFA